MQRRVWSGIIVFFLLQMVTTVVWAVQDNKNWQLKHQDAVSHINSDTSLKPMEDVDIETLLFDSSGMETVDEAYTCTATLDDKLSIHVPLLAYLVPAWGAPSFWADLVYTQHKSYPESILFKLTNFGIVQSGSYSCNPSTLSDEVIVHIQDMVLPNGFTHVWVYLEYLPEISTASEAYFNAVKYGLLTN